MINVLGLLILFLVSSCGIDGDHEAADSKPLPSTVRDFLRFPTQVAIDQGRTAGTSYLVAFRGEVKQNLAPMSGTMLRAAQVRLKSQLFIEPAVTQSRLLANLNLRVPGQSFYKKPAIPLPRTMNYLQGEWGSGDEMASIMKVEFTSHREAKETLTRWYQDKKIWNAEPNYVAKLDGELEEGIIDNFSDAGLFPWLAQVRFIDAISRFASIPPQSEPVIAVLDSGVDVEHPALQDSIYLNQNGQNKLCLNDLYGCDTTQPGKDFLGSGSVYPAGTTGFSQSCGFSDNCEHGTHVAGIVAARGNDFTGLCPYCKVMVVKVVNVKVDSSGVEQFQIEDAAIVAGLAYLSGFTVNGDPLVRVINASFGKFQKSRNVGLFIEALKNFGRGTLMVAAAGNEDTMKEQYPAAFEDVVAVANVNSDSLLPKKARSSNFGMWVDISAPGSGNCNSGSGILSSIPGGFSSCRGGTSMSSPVVAGIAGLVLAAEPNISYGELRDRVLNSASPEPLYSDGVNNAYRPQIGGQQLVPLLGRGVVNALAAVDPSQSNGQPVITQNRDAVKPGCGSIGLEGQGSFGLMILLLLPLTLVFKRS